MHEKCDVNENNEYKSPTEQSITEAQQKALLPMEISADLNCRQ
jgi:hypothetical protein